MTFCSLFMTYLMIFTKQVVVCVNLHLSLPLSASIPDFVSELGNLVPLDSGVDLVSDVAVVHVGLVVRVDARHRPVILALLRVVGEELRPEVARNDAHTDGVAVVHQELATGQVDVAE